MADEFGLTKNVAATPKPMDAKPLEQRESLSPQMASVNFAGEVDRIAGNPSALGEIGANMALQAGIKQGEIIGQYQGLNPHGEVLPPITKADQAYVNAYSNQAQATLSLRMQQMMDEGRLELEKDYELSPDKIAAYTQNMTEGAKNIASLAPSTVKANLENNFASTIERSSTQLMQSQISQQKERARSQQLAYQMDLQNKIHDAQLDRNTELASKLMEQLKSSVASASAIGQITPLQAQTALQAATLTNETGKQIATALSLQAKNDGSYEKYLSDMAVNKPKDIAWHDWEKIRTGTLSYLGQVENFQQRQQSLDYSNGLQEISSGTFNDGRAAYYKQTLKPQLYNNLMGHYYAQQRKGASAQFEAQQLAADSANPLAYVDKKPKTINAAFDLKVQGLKEKAVASGKPIDDFTAEYMAQNAMARAVPKYIEKLDVSIQSGNPALMEPAIQSFERLYAADPIKMSGIDSQTIGAMMMYKQFKTEYGDSTTAASQVKEILTKNTPQIQELSEQKTSEYFKKFKTSEKKESWATNLIDAKAPVFDNDQLFDDAKTIFSGFMSISRGNVKASLDSTRHALNSTYGETYVNGNPQVVKNPIEKVLNMQGATGIIQENIYEQLKPQIENANKALEQTKQQFRYELAPRMTMQEYIDGQKKLEELEANLPAPSVLAQGLGLDKVQEVRELRDKLNQYDSGEPIKLMKVFKDHKEELTVQLNGNSSLQVLQDGSTFGDWQIQALDERGYKANLMGYFGGLNTVPVYRPNKQQLQDRSLLVNGRPMTWKEFMDKNRRLQLGVNFEKFY